jgi:tRNA(Ile)-lysidine synthetase-like protein
VISTLRASLPVAILAGEQAVVLALSGGRDSMVLWHALRRLGVRRHIWHGDHGWRPESADDAAWLQAHVAAAGDFVHIAAMPAAPADAPADESTNLEAAARAWRYTCLQKLAQRTEATAILTAHHADDQAESVLANIRRGCGPRGLQGIAQVQHELGSVPVLRPLLACSRQDLVGVAAAWQIEWREDASNADLQFQRNWLRHEVLPALEAGVPGIAEELAQRALARQQPTHHLRRHFAEQAHPEAPQHYRRSGWLIEAEELPGAAADRWPAWSSLADELGITCSRQWLAAFDGLLQGETGRRLDWQHLLFERRKQGVIWAPRPEMLGALSRSPTILAPGEHTEFQGWSLRNVGQQSVLLSMAEDGEHWAPRGQMRAWRRDLAEASVPLLWRPLWPVVRNRDGELLGAPSVRWLREVTPVAGQVRLDCEWHGFKVMPNFHPPYHLPGQVECIAA